MAARFYSQIPTMAELEQGFENVEDEPYRLPFLDRAALIDTMAEMSAFSAEFDPPDTAESGFSWKNPAFSHSDALA